jgi:nucleotidyltransferase substrate binding protein (TIGR01987 family)
MSRTARAAATCATAGSATRGEAATPLVQEDLVTLDATALANAVQRLREGLARCAREPADEQLRDGLIQRFEFTYELGHKMLRRYLRETAASLDAFERMPFADLIRAGSAQGLPSAGWPAWRRFREMRSRTSHVYDAQAALAVVAGISEFLQEAEHLCSELQRRLA